MTGKIAAEFDIIRAETAIKIIELLIDFPAELTPSLREIARSELKNLQQVIKPREGHTQ